MEKLLWMIAIINLMTALVGLLDRILTLTEKLKKPRAGRRKASKDKKRK